MTRRSLPFLVALVLILSGGLAFSRREAGRHPRVIALTFDDGPHPGYTERLITILREHDAPSTFFLVGFQAVRYPYLAQALALAGHEIGNHSFTHRNLSRAPAASAARELEMTGLLLEDIAGKSVRFFRPPGGQYNSRVPEYGRSAGERMALWTVFPRDHEQDDPSVIIQRVLAQAHDGGVVLLHSGREPTLEALPQILIRLRQRGYRFVTLSEMDRLNKRRGWLR